MIDPAPATTSVSAISSSSIVSAPKDLFFGRGRRTGAAPRAPLPLYGLALAVAAGVFPMMLGPWVPFIGGAVFWFSPGITIRHNVGVGPGYKPGDRKTIVSGKGCAKACI